MLTAELELSFIDTGSFQGQVHGQVLQIVDIFMFQTLKYLNIDCLILIMTVTCKNNLHCKYHKLFPPCVAPEPKWKMTCPACAGCAGAAPKPQNVPRRDLFFLPQGSDQGGDQGSDQEQTLPRPGRWAAAGGHTQH